MSVRTDDTDAAGSEKMQKTDKTPDRKYKGNGKGGAEPEQPCHAAGEDPGQAGEIGAAGGEKAGFQRRGGAVWKRDPGNFSIMPPKAT